MLRQFQKKLRASSTIPEKLLWSFIRNRRLDGYKFRRQQRLCGFIVDFVCYEKKLIIELDGEHHAEQEEKDAARTDKLAQYGFRILRFWNRDVLHDVGIVLEAICYALKNTPCMLVPIAKSYL